MSTQVLRVFTYLSAFCGFGVLIYAGFGAAVELLTGFGLLHNQSLWALFHPGVGLWFALLALMAAASITSWLANRSLRTRTRSQEHLA